MLCNVLKSVCFHVPDKLYLSILYWWTFKENLNWHNPLTFNAKLNWLKVNYRDKRCITIVDKSEVKKYVTQIIGEQYVIKTIKEWENPADLSIDTLPENFVLKTNHDSGTVIICQDKKTFNIELARSKLGDALATDFSRSFREWPYAFVRRKIIAEQFLETPEDEDLKDYKFFCFNGEPKFLKVDFNRSINHRANYYSLTWQLLPFGESVYPPDPTHKIEKPYNFDLMIELASKLASGFPFVRVDLYNIDGKIYFGEMTLFPAAGFGHFIPGTADLEIGHLLNIEI